MRCVDVNVLVYAHRSESPDHDAVRAWLEHAAAGPEPLGLPELALSAYLRIVTNRRIFLEPTPTDVAVDSIERMLAAPAVETLRPGRRHLGLFLDLCRRTRAMGNDVPDAYYVALAIEHGCTFVTADPRIRRFPDVRIDQPFG